MNLLCFTHIRKRIQKSYNLLNLCLGKVKFIRCQSLVLHFQTQSFTSAFIIKIKDLIQGIKSTVMKVGFCKGNISHRYSFERIIIDPGFSFFTGLFPLPMSPSSSTGSCLTGFVVTPNTSDSFSLKNGGTNPEK